jgi:hypothetical protein
MKYMALLSDIYKNRKKIVSGVGRGLGDVFGTYARTLGEAGYQAGRFVTNPLYRKSILTGGQGMSPTELQQASQLNNTRFLRPDQIQNRTRTAVTGGTGTAKAMLGAYGLTAGLPAVASTAAVSGLINTGIAKATGGDPYEAFGYGVGSSSQYGGLNRLTGPFIDQRVAKLGLGGKSLLTRTLRRAGASAGFNLGEDALFTAGTEGRMITPKEALASLAIGGITGPLSRRYNPTTGFKKELVENLKKPVGKVNLREMLSRKASTKSNLLTPKARSRYELPEGRPIRTTGGKSLEDLKTGDSVKLDRRFGSRETMIGRNGQSAYGAVAGIEPYQDEDGKWQVRFNPEKAALGVGGMVLGTGAIKKLDDLKTGLGDETDIRGLTSVARQSKTYDEFVSRVQDTLSLSPETIGKLQDAKLSLKDFYNQAATTTQGGTQKTPKVGGTVKASQLPESTMTARSLDDVLQGKQTTLSSQKKTGSEIPLQSETKAVQSNQGALTEDIISEGRKSIGSTADEPKGGTKKVLDDLYTQWVDRYHPINKAGAKVKTYLKTKNAQLRPEYDPEYLLRRLTGAGGVADYRFKTELNPILKQMEGSGIEKLDMDTYLAHNRMLGFDEAGREIYGVDPVKSKAVVEALEQKYPEIKNVAQQFYGYQDKGLQELIDAGFISSKDADVMRGQNPNYAPLYRVMDELDDYLGLPTRKTMQGTSPIKKIKGSERQILSPVESLIGNTFSQRAAIEKNRVAKSIAQLNEVMPDLGFEKVKASGDDTITVWNNGAKEYWRVGKDIADTAKGVNEEVTNTLLKIVQAPAQLLRQGATGRNPEFMIPNIIRDQIDAGITSKYGYIPFVDFVSGLRSMVKNDDVYQSWQKSGAKIDLGELSGRKSISKLVNEKTNRRNLFQWISAGLDVAGKYSEQPTRVGLYKKALKKTGNPLLSAMESRDATVDFARMGSKMKVANSIIPFLNVGVQGFDKLIRATKERPGRVLLNAGIYAAAPALMTTLYNLTNFKEEYMEIPQYEKDSNFVLVKGRNADGTVDYLTFPKGNVVPFVANPLQSFMEYFAGADEQGFKAMALSTLSEGLPVLSGGGSLKEIGLKTIGSNLPQAIKPITEGLINKSFYKYDERKGEAKDIVPYYLKDKPAYQQDYEFTPQMYKKIGAVFNVSPLQVKNLMEGYLAGYTKIPSQIIEAVYKTANGEPINPNDKTLIRRFVKQTYPTSKTKAVEETPEAPNVFKRVFGDTKEASAAEELPTNPADLKVLYDDAQKIISNYTETSAKIRTGLKDDQTLPEAQEEVAKAQAFMRQLEAKQPEVIYNIGLDDNALGGGRTTDERAEWVVDWLGKAKDQTQYDKWYQEMLDKKVITKEVLEKARALGLDIDKYHEGGEVKSIGGSGGGSGKSKKLSAVFDALSEDIKDRETLRKSLYSQTRTPDPFSILDLAKGRKSSSRRLDDVLKKISKRQIAVPKF